MDEPTPIGRGKPAESLSALWELKSEFYHGAGQPVELIELTTEQAMSLWEDLTELERQGRIIDIYRLLVLHGAHWNRERVFANLTQTLDLPVRHLVPMGEAMLRLCDMGIDANPETGQDEPSSTG